MRTTFKTSNGYTIEIEQIDGLGAPWLVRTYKKLAFLKRRVSSDWFLNAEQAQAFTKQLISDIETANDSTALIRSRKPGWILKRPAH
jgi:hypothetical protein